MAGAFCSPYPYCLHCTNVNKQDKSKDCCGYATEQLELVLKQQSHPDETAAIIIEPVLGEGGYIVPPLSWMKSLREICDKHNMLLIFDEVQTGIYSCQRIFLM